ncbi:molybdopterin molybdotransferase MoeA [Mesorhizobium sp. B2-2-4]|uniref:molybdopterin molybdotransferase MoeA n=1 Tax=unclassified Mesorhizobium TaxID=325217 RepID=UPI00112EF953|nr:MULTISPECIES: gephyrin-like molybdotransferase Glp [unclassified Mesorhizobium]MBZ9918892.1 molybdopterin molybdotransferase MoeA [Mesorhizobium sp. BR1-1-7]MBZ9970721.1 molybdopterin molybdotransferase MoeA [Mesorhizobium sp. BR1-1-12]MBZ9970780.1 molybdopterin molybdotransferase MoeA [Mesorhizobium sp. BR1-1-12]TPM56195.1 molybdopterin molybdotransferase MoeA [Mesorhizobium sp. B2-2-4]TPM68242.1 molybdopterin molybdotransferase MoeA [Mesorhizobium sp. B2-2-1]
MAQISDDCFAFGGQMRPIDETAALIASKLSAVEEVETVPLLLADGRVLAKEMVASLALPPFTNSAVDGYAVRGADLPQTVETAFAVAGRVQAGMAANEPVRPGQTVRIFTGAPMPDGADTVFMQEDVSIDGSGRILLPPGLKKGANVRPAGEDVALGETVLPAGHRMRPQDIALAAALGFTELQVRRRIRVAVFSTGDEIVAPGDMRGQAQLFDSNRFMLTAMLARLCCDITDLGILVDDGSLIAEKLSEAALSHDLILTSGGVSTGEADCVKAAVESAGTLVFWRVAIKPGRPVAMGVIDGTPLIGLPGNPVASFVTFAHIARPAILALAGALQQPPTPIAMRAAFSYSKKQGRREYVRASVRAAADGCYEATKFPREGAGLLSSLVATDGLVELGEEIVRVEPGHTVQFLPYSSLM